MPPRVLDVAGAPPRRQWLRGVVAGGLLVGLTGLVGCGFKLRGPLQLPFTRLRTNLSDRSELGRELRAQLQASGVQLFDMVAPPGQPQEPVDAVLEVLSEQRERSVVGSTATGQVREFQLRTRFKFRVRTPKGRDLILDTELLQERDLSYDESLALGKAVEEGMLHRDMQADIVRQVMRRLAALQGV